MDVVPGRRANPKSEQVTSTFTGTVRREALLNVGDVGMGGVYFEAGARSYWHSHEHAQILAVQEGNGICVTRDGEIAALTPHDFVHAPGGEEHWHGATPGSSMLHTSITFGAATWLEEVTDEQYKKATDALARGESKI